MPVTRSKKRRPSDVDLGGRGSPYPRKKNRQGTNPPPKPSRLLGGNTALGFREPRGYNRSGSFYDRRSPQRGLDDTYRPRPTWGSYGLDSSRFEDSRAAASQPVTSSLEGSVRPRGRSPIRRYHQLGASDERGVGRATRKPLPDHRDHNGIPNDARSWSPRPRDRTDGPAGPYRFRDGNSRSPPHAGKGIETEAPNGPPFCNTRARNPSQSSLTHNRDFLDLARGLSGFSLTKESPKLLPESHDLGQPTKELSSLGENSNVTNLPERSLTHDRDFLDLARGLSRFSLTKDSFKLPESHDLDQPTKELSLLGENNNVTSSAGSQPDINVPHLRGRESPPEDTSHSCDSRSPSPHRLCSQREGGSSRLEESRVLPVLFYESPVLKLKHDFFLPESASADRELYVKAGTPGELCALKSDSAPSPGPSDSTWRTANFTPSNWELVHGRARQAKNRASAALLPDNVPLFGPKIRTSRKGKFRGSLEEYDQMLLDKEKTEHDDDPTFPTGSWEDDDSTSSSSEGEDYDITSLKNTLVFEEGLPRSKSQWGTPPGGETQTQSKSGPLAEDTHCASGVPDGGACGIEPTKKLAMARGKQLRPELVQAIALLRASRSQSVHPERECGGGQLPLASEGPPDSTRYCSGDL
ncbi:hypothetical protein B9Z19DRAFT_1127116 [Tuber borchii]|uniref:Uncharacterized protein n=1 Tax=Tuber borchii TaxID=42251 RepID=A0A2T6ZS04_TUBBO|nr:hypothetical protein B9Z19DRAFT_1127116 [Tuber borchii]